MIQTGHRWQGYRHTLRICNTYCFATATMVTRTRLNVTLYVHCLSCFTLGPRYAETTRKLPHTFNVCVFDHIVTLRVTHRSLDGGRFSADTPLYIFEVALSRGICIATDHSVRTQESVVTDNPRTVTSRRALRSHHDAVWCVTGRLPWASWPVADSGVHNRVLVVCMPSRSYRSDMQLPVLQQCVFLFSSLSGSSLWKHATFWSLAQYKFPYKKEINYQWLLN